MSDDRLPALLEEIRERHAKTKDGLSSDATAYINSQEDVPRLLAVVDKVLAAHRNADGRCAWCRNADGQRQKWPCGEYLAISRALTGEESADVTPD